MPSDSQSSRELEIPDLAACDDEESSAGALEPGLLVAAQPLGLDPTETPHTQRDAPDQKFSQWRRRGGLARHLKSRPTLGSMPLTVRDENTADEDDQEEKDEKEKKEKGQSRGAQALSYIRGKLSEDGIAQITAMIHDPSLALTTIQSDLLGKIGRLGSHGDKTGVRRALMELVEKVDVSSPKDSAVLIAREEAGDMLSSNVSQQMARLDSGKQSLQMTQGGRVVSQLQSILGQHKAFGWADGMDRGWRRLTERFGQQANGAVDVVVGGAKPSEGAAVVPGAAGAAAPPAQAQVGAWNVSGSGASAPGAEPKVGSWAVPQAGGPGSATPGQPPVGQWTIGAPAEGGSASGAGPGPGGAGEGPQVGKWGVPGQQIPGAPGQVAGAPGQEVAPKVGQWTTQPGAGAPGGGGSASPPGGGPAVGKWNVPGSADLAAAGADAAKGGGPPVGTWKVPGGADVAASAADAAKGAAPSQPVGQWNTAAPSGEPAVGKFTTGADIPLAGDLNLSELLKQNPNISNVRIVELVQSAEAKQPPKLRAITDIARSVFGKKFGF